jgi:hypothetical protein
VHFTHRYCGARCTRAVAASAHSNDGYFDINRPLLLLPTLAMTFMTSDDHCYYGACGTRVGATSTNSSNGQSAISGPLLLLPAVAMGDMTSGGTRAVATGAHNSDGSYDIR